VGGRVAGASTALLLARAGVRVLVLDRDRPGSDTVSTHALMRAGVLQLSRWGILPRVVAAGTPPVRRTFFHYEGGHRVQVSIRPSPGVDALYAPRRTVLDRLLLEAAAEAGADVRHGVTVADVLRRDDGRVVGVTTVRRGASSVSTVHAEVTVGADGLRSTVAPALGAPVTLRGSHAGAALYRYVDGIADDAYQWGYGDHAGAGLIPTNEGLTCVFVGTDTERLRRLRRHGAEHAFAVLLEAAAPALAARVRAAVPVTPMRGWAGAPGLVRRPWGPGWALVGDAGLFRDPITTHGMTDALRDAELLAEAVVESLSGRRRPAVAGASYERTRDRLSRPLFRTTDAIASYTWDATEIGSLLRQVSAAMSDEVDHLQARAAVPRSIRAA
jgi:flavin-dependent dehydrogenase